MTETISAFCDATEQARMIADREITAVALTRLTLDRIAALDPILNAFTCVLGESALNEAAALDAEYAATGRTRGPLHGVPVAIKDDNDVAGVITTFGGSATSKPAARDGEAVRRLRAAGAVIIGKTTLPEFGVMPFTESIAFGATRNPWDPSLSASGSSGGSAAAVASGMVAAAIGTDGGGSVRLPASYCGLVGLKPQRGRVSTAPTVDLWRMLGTIGPLTRSVRDCALLCDVIAGQSPTDKWTTPALASPLSAAIDAPFRRLRIAISERHPGRYPHADAETLAALHATADALRELGHVVEPAEPRYPAFVAEFIVLMLGGVSDEATLVDHPELIEPRVRQLLGVGKLFSGNKIGAWAERRAVAKSEQINRFFDSYDLLLTPTSPTPAVPHGGAQGNIAAVMNRGRVVSAFTAVWNIAGNPVVALPTGYSAAGLPLSAQLVGPVNGEPAIIEVAAQIERARPWSHRRPTPRVAT
ncbi:amidase family protein [Nocardia sp. CA-128927]|uniref:amidase family protein n=1 Tax=Nocardia sp. CA-128927 TaxID=3239975 RepID=UPI003D976D87